MKIDVTLMRRRINFDGPITVIYETIRIPSTITTLDQKTVQKILDERVKRIRRLKKYREEYEKTPISDDHSDRILISWSPIITTSALEFICQNF